jgi:hypothetical protein
MANGLMSSIKKKKKRGLFRALDFLEAKIPVPRDPLLKEAKPQTLFVEVHNLEN